MINIRRFVFFFGVLSVLFACTSPKDQLSKEIANAEQQLLKDSIIAKDTALAHKVIRLYLKYADENANDTVSGSYMFKAADLSVGIQDPATAVQLLDKMITKFPNHSKAASALFYQAFIYDTYLHNVNSAKEKYRVFLEKYPNDEMATSATATLMQLEAGLSDEELVKMFQAKNDSLAALGQAK